MSKKSDDDKPTLRVVSDNAADPLFADYGPTVGGRGTAPAKKQRKPFKTAFVQVPMRWIVALEGANADSSAYKLALRLLAEAFKCSQVGGDVVLSSNVTGMPRSSKSRAAKELQRLGLNSHRAAEGEAVVARSRPGRPLMNGKSPDSFTRSPHCASRGTQCATHGTHCPVAMEHTSLLLFFSSSLFLFSFFLKSLFLGSLDGR